MAVREGIPIESLISLEALVHPDVAERVIDAYWKEDGPEPLTYTIDLGCRFLSIARQTGCFDEAALERLDDMRASLEIHRHGGLTGPIYFVFGKCDSLQLAGGTFHQDLDLTGTQITSELNLGSSRFGPAQWPGTPILVLRNVTTGAIQDLPASWPSKLDLVGFTYRNLGGLGDEISGPIADRDAEWFVDWFSRSHYSPQPYEQLASVMRVQGRPGEADRILYAGRERERLGSSGLDYLWQSVLKIVIGYGYRAWLAVIWLGVLWLFGAFVQWTRPAASNRRIDQLLLYSFEMLLPVIRLRGQTREFRSGLQDVWFNIQSLLGLVLTAFLAAGLAGLTK